MIEMDTRTDLVGVGVAIIPASPLLPHAQAVPADRHPVKVYLARLDVRSRRTMLTALNSAAMYLTGGRLMAEHLPWASLGYQHMMALRTALTPHYAPATANRILTAVRSVLKECQRLGYISLEQQMRVSDIPSIRGERLLKGRMLTRDELAKLFCICAEDAGSIGRRDAALIAILYGTGLRRSEVVNLDLQDYDVITGALTVRAGKGNKDRQLFAGTGAAHAMREWLAIRGQALGPLFVPINKSGRLIARRLSDKAVVHILKERATEADIKAFSPHDLRRSFISSLLSSGVDPVTVSAMAGHASVTTMAKYDRRGEEAKRTAAERLIIPFVSVQKVS
jgi:site-specific recombinase XerD